MGWKLSLILVDGVGSEPLESTVGRLVGDPVVGEDSETEVDVPMSDGAVTVRTNELLDLATTRATFAAFFDDARRPGSLTWRDVTDRFSDA